MRRVLNYRDALMLLGGDSPVVAALDRALAGALSVATAGVSGAVLDIFGAQGRIIGLGRDLVVGLRGRLRGAAHVDRMQRLEAAHTVIVVTAYFEALSVAPLPFAVRDMRITRQEQIVLAGGSTAREFADALLSVVPPRPGPFLPYEQFLDELAGWYSQLSARLTAFARGLVMWADLGDAGRQAAEGALGDALCRAAVGCYQEMYAQLAVEVPEFQFWSGQVEHQATRAHVRQALAGVESLLASLSPGRQAADTAAALSSAYRAVLRRPILAEGETPTGVRLPTLEEGYLDPDFRVSPVEGGELPSDESWWDGVAVRSDLADYLAGALTSPDAMAAPLVVLGHPGAGKSVLTKMLAARLPAADFLPVRVVLREVPAESEIQDQVEFAIRATTGLRSDWPSTAMAVDGAIPVVLFDGFDELLQATGVSQSDYLLKVARFQQREADQGRPVVALVTSRIAVADRARYPPGTVALRLEPFRDEQVASWLGIWNRHNEQHLRACGMQPLTADVVARHRALASEPLLLLMLALYDADANALQRGGPAGGQALDETELYEELLTAFATREVSKTRLAMSADETASSTEQELQRLSLIAFGMINRHRLWVTEAELGADLAALLGRPAEPVPAGFRAPLSQSDLVVGRFFFVQRAQAVRDGRRLQTYEFLHATFGEYLAARLTVQLTAGLLTRRPALTVGRVPADDDLLYVLLSFAPLSSRQMLRFVRRLCQRDVPAPDRRHLADLLVTVLTDSQQRTEHRYASYVPAALPTSSRHGIYSANLVLMILALASSMTTSELFPHCDDPPGRWHRRALLWRSSLTEPDWTDLALALSVRHVWHGSERELEVRLSEDPRRPPDYIDLYWHYHYPPGHPERGDVLWHRPYWDAVFHKMDISSGTNDTSIRHALEPIFRWLGPSITTFHGTAGRPPSSIAHQLLDLWLIRTTGSSDDDLIAAYQQLEFLFGPPLWDTQMQRHAAMLVLDFLKFDAVRLPAATVIGLLTAALRFADRDGQLLQLVLESAMTAIGVTRSAEHRSQLTRIADQAISIMRNACPPDGLLAWITTHDAEYSHGLSEQLERLVSSLPSRGDARPRRHAP